MANLAELAAELLNNIVQWCSHIDIKHLSETCRLLHNKMVRYVPSYLQNNFNRRSSCQSSTVTWI